MATCASASDVTLAAAVAAPSVPDAADAALIVVIAACSSASARLKRNAISPGARCSARCRYSYAHTQRV
jgi:hypothetical protein